MSKNGETLRKLVDEMKVDQDEALNIWNKGQAEPLTPVQWKAYMAQPNTPSWKPCPDSVVLHMDTVLRDWRRKQIESDGSRKI